MAKKHVPTKPDPLASVVSLLKGLDAALDRAIADPDSVPGAHATEGNPLEIAPRVLESDEWAEKQISNTVAGSERWKRNVRRPRKNPFEAGIAAAGKHKQKTMEALNDDRYAKGLRNVDEEAYLDTLDKTPATALSDGVQRREMKIKHKVAKVRTLTLAVAVELDKMPTDTDAQREAKMIAARRAMIEVGKKLKA